MNYNSAWGCLTSNWPRPPCPESFQKIADFMIGQQPVDLNAPKTLKKIRQAHPSTDLWKENLLSLPTIRDVVSS